MATNPQRPPKVQPRLIGAPKIRQLYWCDFPEDAQLPEFWKRRPVVIISYRNTLHGAVSVIPCSTSDQTGNNWAVRMQTTINGNPSWAICDKPSTYAVSRLSVDRSGIVQLPVVEFDEILHRLFEWLPKPNF
jgi:mRNA interferase MazF